MTEFINKEWINPNRVKYFELEDFIEKIKLEPRIYELLSETDDLFEDYIKHLSNVYDNALDSLVYDWLDQGIKEQMYSNEIENHRIFFKDMAKSDLFFEKLSINHERIKRIHKFVCDKGTTHTSIVGDYRKDKATVGTNINGEYVIYWNGVEAEDIKKFMDNFIKVYKTNSVKEIYNNPFLKAALVHLLFVRIHPFGDGNGRTTRIIQNIAFTNGINKIYGSNLKLSPLNISQGITVTKFEYVDILNKIHFDLDYDNNELINAWFKYMLYRYQDQIYYQQSRFGKIDKNLEDYLKRKTPKVSDKSIEKMKINKLFT